MKTDEQLDLTQLEDYRWMPNGQSVFTGKLLRLFKLLDHEFAQWALQTGATEYAFPTFLPAKELAKLHYFSSFPHLVTFPVTLDAGEQNLAEFAGRALAEDESVSLTQLSPARDVLTPAACYHFYVHLQKTTVSGPQYFTTRANCFRREKEYIPLQRQWNFSMREIVCLGTSEQVRAFLEGMRKKVSDFFKEIGLPIEWQTATDPFFNPSKNPKYLMQKLDPVKTEMIYDGHLAIGSTNFHRNYFGESFEIQCNGEDAYSGCIAFGLERWMYTFLKQFGTDESSWPPIGESRV
jgi:seryl-tRNA synthetase